MIRITPEHIYVLRNSTGKPFTDLLDRLIRSSAALVGIPPSAVLDNPRTNYPDGGVDTQVTTAATRSDPWNYFEQPSTWQYKAVQLTDLPANNKGGNLRQEQRLRSQSVAAGVCLQNVHSP